MIQKSENQMEKEYLKLQKKYNLPQFTEIKEELELDPKDENPFPIKLVRRKLHDKLTYAARVIEIILFPNPSSLPNIYESKFFDEKEKEDMGETYKKILSLERESNRLDILPSEKEDAKFFIKALKEWEKIKPKIANILKKTEISWQKEKSSIEDNHYFG